MFGDICDVFFDKGFLDEGSFIQKLLHADGAALASHAFCHTHNTYCGLWPGRSAAAADVEVAGLPCTDYSKAGRRQRHEGVTNKVFISHAKRHVELGTPLLILENVWDMVDKTPFPTAP